MSEFTKVYMICFAYEQGVGTGQSSRSNPSYYKKSMNPYKVGSDEHEAWGYGFDSGADHPWLSTIS